MAHMQLFEALADPTRRQIVLSLRCGEQQVTDIVDQLEIHQSGVSRHLRLLLKAGFVNVRPDGPKRLYSLRPEPFQELDEWTASFRHLWAARLDRFEVALEKQRAEKKTPPKKRRTP
jgi:DNA-binding transcriptional ArsR family regulator